MLGELADLILPRRCLSCERTGVAWCPSCRALDPRVRRIPGLPPVHAATEYSGSVRSALVAYKERGRRDLTRPLAQLLASAIEAATGPDRPVLVVPMPSSPRAVRARGGDHMLRLARSAARLVGVPVSCPLQVVRRVHDAAGLTSAQRRENVRGAFEARPPRPGEQLLAVVLVDDIVTTGASFREASRALYAAGWKVHGLASVASTSLPQRQET
jgi:predicted amidophosphoribosyltransferase